MPEEMTDLEVLAEGEDTSNKEEVIPDESLKEESAGDKEPSKVEVENENEGEDDDEDDEIKVQTRPTIAQIKEKYPDIFKDFPDIKEAIFRESKYSEIYPTIEDAEDARDKSDDFDNLSGLIFSGSPEDLGEFIKAVEKGGEGAVSSLASNFLPSLYKVNQDAYFEAITPLLENVAKQLYRDGVKSNNDNLKNGALLLAQYLWNDQEIASSNKSNVKVKDDSARKEIEKERHALKDQKYQEVQTSVNTRCIKILNKAINDGLDPGNVLSNELKDILAEKIQKEINRVLFADQGHMRNMTSLWNRAYKAGFTGDWEARIRTAYLARAKSVLPAIREKIRAAATGQKLDEVDKKRKIASLDSNRVEIQPSGKVPSQNGKTSITPPASKIDWSKTSDVDILNDRVVLRK